MFKTNTKSKLSEPRMSVEEMHEFMLKNLPEDKKTSYLLNTAAVLNEYCMCESGDRKGEINNEYIDICFAVDEDTCECFVRRGIAMSSLSRCEHCGSTILIVDIANLVCADCGTCTMVDMEPSPPNHDEQPDRQVSCPYRRSNHFNEWLAQHQGRNCGSVPDDVFEVVLCELHKERITDLNSINVKQIRDILKRVKLNKHYENIPYIISQLTGRNTRRFSAELEMKLKAMFSQVQPAFEKHCPSNRKNFLSYSYVLHKMCILQGEHIIAKQFTLLKSREKLQQQVGNAHLFLDFYSPFVVWGMW